VLALRRKHAGIDLAVRAADNYRVHRTGRNATLVAHYFFVSVFPLMLVFVTVLGFVLETRPKWRESIVDSVASRIPFIGRDLAADSGNLQGNVFALVGGLLLTLWAGMRAFNVLQSALDDVAAVPLDDRRNLVHARARSLLGIAIVGVSQIGAAVLTSLVGVAGVSGLFKLGFAASAVLVNTLVLAASYRWLCVREQTWREVAPGAVVGGVLFAGLQVTGTAIVGRAIANASSVYGDFATVIGLLTYLTLHSTVALLCAELNHALPARRYQDPPPPVGAGELAATA